MRCVLPLPAPARTRTLRTTHQHAACESRFPRVKGRRSVAAGPMRRWTGRWLRPLRTRRSTRWCSSTRRCSTRSSRRWECENLQAIRGPWPLRLVRPPRPRIRAVAPPVFEPWCHRRSAVWSPEATLVFEHCPSGISGRGCPPPARDATAPKAVSPARVFRVRRPRALERVGFNALRGLWPPHSRAASTLYTSSEVGRAALRSNTKKAKRGKEGKAAPVDAASSEASSRLRRRAGRGCGVAREASVRLCLLLRSLSSW